MDIMVLRDPELEKLGCLINGGAFGKDPCRLNKLAKVAHIRELARNKYGPKANEFVDGLALSILNAREVESEGQSSSRGQGYGKIENTGGEAQGTEGSEEETESEEQEGWESEHSEDFQDSEDYDSEGNCKECWLEPEQDGHAGNCPTFAKEEELREEFENSQQSDNGQGEEFEDGDDDSAGKDDSEEQEDSSEDSFGDQNEEEGKNPKDDSKSPPKDSKEQSKQQQQEQQKRDLLEERVREIVDSMFEEKLFPNLDAGLSNGFEQVKVFIHNKLEEQQEPQVNEEQVRSIVEELLAQVKPQQQQARELKIEFPKVPQVSCSGKHPIFPKVLALAALSKELRQPIMLVGPAGSGKSHLCFQVAEALGIQYGALSLSADMTRGAIEGRVMPLGKGKYVASEFVRIAEDGGLYLFDEIDAAAAEVLVTINAPLANGGMHVEARAVSGLATYVPLHEDLRIFAAANTFGTGPTAQYVGRSQMDAATLDRWLILYMGYDPALNAAILGASYAPEPTWEPVQRTDAELREALVAIHGWLDSVQYKAEQGMLKRVVSIRARLRARALLTAGFTMEETQEVLLAGWKDDEKARVLD